MLKTKFILCGISMQILIFLILMSIISLCAVSFGDISNPNYILALEISSYLSVAISSFIIARITWEKGGLYGIIIALAFLIIRLICAWVFKSNIATGEVCTKLIILILTGFVSGALGVSGSKEKNYFT